ncbi:hypothetical protein A6U98_12315 [Rhizobium sp. WYCCWR10014]|nr:hypothetical protein A6U98_12315 [Rhizobium sp. WYCCWR10014]
MAHYLLRPRGQLSKIGVRRIEVTTNDFTFKDRIEAIKVRLVSTHGAGDEFTGVLAAEIAGGTGLEGALHAANHAAAVLVSTPRDISQ